MRPNVRSGVILIKELKNTIPNFHVAVTLNVRSTIPSVPTPTIATRRKIRLTMSKTRPTAGKFTFSKLSISEVHGLFHSVSRTNWSRVKSISSGLMPSNFRRSNPLYPLLVAPDRFSKLLKNLFSVNPPLSCNPRKFLLYFPLIVSRGASSLVPNIFKWPVKQYQVRELISSLPYRL